MSSLVKKLFQAGLIQAPEDVVNGVQYETRMGSHAFGVANKASDEDVYGFYMPRLDNVPASGGIESLARGSRYSTFKQLGIVAKNAADGSNRDLDLKIDSIFDFFQRCLENNANALEMLFVNEANVLHQTATAKLVRDNRQLFLHKGASYKDERADDRSIIGGFAYVQFDDLKHKRLTDGKRQESIDRYGYDVKAAYHVVRLMDEAEQLLSTGDIDLQRSRAMLKEIREGKWSLAQVVEHYERKDKELAVLHATSSLPVFADEAKIEQLLLDCLALHAEAR